VSGEAPAGNYQAYGLKIRSELALPELFPDDGFQVPDVTIRRGLIEVDPTDHEICEDGAALLLTIPNVARYRIADGREIVIEASDGVPDRNLRLFLLGSAFGALLHQRGMLPLHANAIEVDGRAIAFMGEAGAGKSTLAAWFHDQGFRVVADDVCVVQRAEDGSAYAYPGLPRLRLWDEVLTLTGRDPSRYERSYVGPADRAEKFDVPIEAASAATSALPLAAVFVLDRGSQFSIDRLSGVEAAEAIFANTYRGAYVAPAGGQQAHWAMATTLARDIPMFRARRQWGLELLNDQAARLLSAIRAELR